MQQKTIIVRGQPSFIVATRSTRAALTRLGVMLGPVVFFADGEAPIEPYSVAPWATEPPIRGTLPLMRALRGDFICSAFGDKLERDDGLQIPPHGDTANGEWTYIYERNNEFGTALRLAIDLPSQGGRCVGTTVLLERDSFVYQRHDFSGRSGPINPGHHAMLRCPDAPGSTLLSFSPHVFASAAPPRPSLPATHMRSRLSPGVIAAPLNAMPCVDGTTTDITVFPAHGGTDETAIVCADPKYAIAWSAATFRHGGYAWLSLRNRTDLPATLVWLSNGGLLQPPWNGRHRPVLGLEDVMGFFAQGIAASAADNALNSMGIPTCAWMILEAELRIPYIQGVVRIPADFDRVATIEPNGKTHLLVRAKNGTEVRVSCDWTFLGTGRIPQLCDDWFARPRAHPWR